MRRSPVRFGSVATLAAALLLMAPMLRAQELEARAFSPGPVGMNIAALSVSYNTGDLVFDASLPLEGVTADTAIGAAAYQRFFGLFGRTAKVAVLAAWADSDAEGYVYDQYRERKFEGLMDPRIAFSIIFAGAPAMTPQEYAKYKPKTLGGFSISVSPPLGKYEEDKLLNAGTNRWTLRSQLGLSHYIGRWNLEGTLGATFFTDNDEFLSSNTQSQDPVLSLQAHCAYTIRPQMWIAAGATYYRGGESSLNGGPATGFQSNSRYGLTASLPVAKGQSLSLAASRGLEVRTGSDYDTVAVTWGIRWLDKK